MSFKRSIPKEDIETVIKERLLNKETYQQIADTYGVSRERIRQYAYQLGLDGYRYKEKQKEDYEKWSIKMKAKYGEFFNGSNVEELDFFQVCREKYRNKKAICKSYGKEFTVEFNNIVWNKVCPILGIELDYYASGRSENSPSFDRINPQIGYVDGNVIIVSWRANRIKNDGTANEHYLIFKYMNNLKTSK